MPWGKDSALDISILSFQHLKYISKICKQQEKDANEWKNLQLSCEICKISFKINKILGF